MSRLTWSREDRPTYDADKARIIDGAPDGALSFSFTEGQELPGDWFLAKDGDAVVGLGTLDTTWGGDAELTLAVDPERSGEGVGSYVLRQLEREAASRDINYVYNTVRDGHPQRDEVHDWLAVRGYVGNERDASLRKRVGTEEVGESPQASQPPAATSVPEGSRGPGHEESGGYVDVEQHHY